MAELGKKVKAIRKEKGITQTQLSQMTGITQATLSRIESGKVRRTSDENYRKICRALDFDTSTLVTGPPTEWHEVEERYWDVVTIEDVGQKLLGVLKSSTKGMTIVDLDGKHFYINKILAQMVGFEPDEMIGTTVHCTTHPADLHLSASYIQDALSGKVTTARINKRHIHKDGSVIHVLVTSSIIRGKHKKPICFVSMVENNGIDKAVNYT